MFQWTRNNKKDLKKMCPVNLKNKNLKTFTKLMFRLLSFSSVHWDIRSGIVSCFSCHSHSDLYNVYPVHLDIAHCECDAFSPKRNWLFWNKKFLHSKYLEVGNRLLSAILWSTYFNHVFICLFYVWVTGQGPNR